MPQQVRHSRRLIVPAGTGAGAGASVGASAATGAGASAGAGVGAALVVGAVLQLDGFTAQLVVAGHGDGGLPRPGGVRGLVKALRP